MQRGKSSGPFPYWMSATVSTTATTASQVVGDDDDKVLPRLIEDRFGNENMSVVTGGMLLHQLVGATVVMLGVICMRCNLLVRGLGRLL